MNAWQPLVLICLVALNSCLGDLENPENHTPASDGIIDRHDLASIDLGPSEQDAQHDAVSPITPIPDSALGPDTKPILDSGPPFALTNRAQMNYFAVPHPDDEFSSWSLIENDPASYQVIVVLTRGENTGYCGSYPGYQPLLGELPPGNSPQYTSNSCQQNRIGSSLAFFEAMCGIDPYVGPMPTVHASLSGISLSPGTPGHGCAVSSNAFEIWTGVNLALVYFDLGDGNLTKCEVEWAVSQTRALRGTSHLPALVENNIIAAGFRNSIYPNCVVYNHPDHVAAHQAVWDTDFATAGVQLGRTCTTDPDHTIVRTVTQYQVMAMNGDQRVGAFQQIYGWLSSNPWPAGDESVSLLSNTQAFWSRF